MNEYIKKNSHLRDFTLNVIYQTAKKFRVCSFTRRWNHILMWAHYANGCRGAALVFDQKEILNGESAREIGLREEQDAQHIPLQWIKYTTHPPVINSVEVLEAIKVRSEDLAESISRKILDACMLTKYKAWRYEQETRMVTRYDSDLGKRPILYKYNELSLKGAIIGNKCTKNEIIEVSKRLPPKSTIYLTKPVESRFKLQIIGRFQSGDIASGKVRIEIINEEDG